MDSGISTLRRVDEYLHAAPLSGARPHEVGPFTLFQSTTAWPYYARPRPGRAGSEIAAAQTSAAQTSAAQITAAQITLADIELLRARCQELRLPLSLEWVVSTAPTLSTVAAAAGLTVVEHPLLVVRPETFVPAPLRPEITVRIAEPDRHTLLAARAVADVAFGHPGTGAGTAGLPARDQRMPLVPADRIAAQLERARAGVTVTAIAVGPDGDPVASGQHQQVGTTSEVVAVATLPAFRRHGLAGAVTSALVEHAFAGGVDLVLLSAEDPDVARVYQRLGFTVIDAAGVAEAVR